MAGVGCRNSELLMQVSQSDFVKRCLLSGLAMSHDSLEKLDSSEEGGLGFFAQAAAP